MEVAKTHASELGRLKKAVENFSVYWQPNYKTFNEFRKFTFDTSLTPDDLMVLETLNKPVVEFNICEAYISRQRGEFAKQEPSITITADDLNYVSADQIDLLKGHLKHIFFDANRAGCEYQVYTDTLSGGFSAIKVWTEYANERSMKQVIRFGRVSDPTLVGFDPLAREPHKGDGRFCFELFPKSKAEFQEEYPDIDLSGINFSRSLGNFNWSYNNNQEDILLICDFYEKEKKRVQLVELANGYVMTKDEYKEFLVNWQNGGMLEQPPGIKGKPRWTIIEEIVRYRFVENKMISYKKTNFKMLPIVFVDGNSVMLRNEPTGAYFQKARPYIYHAKGMQQLKNFAGQTLANELENMIQHKFKVAKESLPDEQSYLDAYTNIQQANTLVYKAFSDTDPNQPVPPPQEIQRIPAPPEVFNTFMSTDQLAQSILGSYDASLGINDNQLSGTAIMEGATQSNAAAMPYIVSFMQSLTQVANIIIDLIPKYYVTKRTLPVVYEDGSRGFKVINDGSLDMNYDSNALSVKVEAGLNFSVQKSKGLAQIMAMTQSSQIFAQFINTKGLKVILDYFEIDGIERLKEMADEFMQEQAQAQKMAQAQQMAALQNSPAMMKVQNDRQKIENEDRYKTVENMIRAQEVAVDRQDADTNFIKVVGDLRSKRAEINAENERSHAEDERAIADLHLKHMDMQHTHQMEQRELDRASHEVKKSED